MDLATAGVPLGHYLTYLTRRQEAIASNIANADTPGYRTHDVELPSFAAALAGAEAVATEPAGLTARSDGNNVSIDRESRLLAETALKFSVATQLARSEFRNLRNAIEEGRSG